MKARHKTPLAVTIEHDLMAELRDAAWHTRRPLSHIVEDAVRKALPALRRKYAVGARFPARCGELVSGRPLSGGES